MYESCPDLTIHELDEKHVCYLGRVPEKLHMTEAQVDALWKMHPPEYPKILIHGRWVPTPRWQQAYGADYHFAGQTSEALTVPSLLSPIRDWACEVFDPRLNGLLLNWYDGSLGHYIGAHRDSTKFMYPGAPIVMVSYGASRTMRLRRWKGRETFDFAVSDGTVCVLPYDTNLAWTHEILRRKRDAGQRVSVTLRAFGGGNGVAAIEDRNSF